MNKYLFFFATVIFFPGNISAQQFKAGLIGGITATQISGDQLGGYNKAGVVAGGMVSTVISPRFDLAMEILYYQKGSKKNSDPENEDYTYYRLRLNYFEVPLFLQWKYSKRFTFEAGPTFGALLSEEEEDEYGAMSQRRPFKSFEIGIAGGLKIHFAKKFSGTARMASSVLPVREHLSGESYRLNKGQYNACLLLGLQYTFRKNNE